MPEGTVLLLMIVVQAVAVAEGLPDLMDQPVLEVMEEAGLVFPLGRLLRLQVTLVTTPAEAEAVHIM